MKNLRKHIVLSERQVGRIEQQMAQTGMTFTDWMRNAAEIKLGRVETVDAIEEAKNDLLRTQEEMRREIAGLRLSLISDMKNFFELIKESVEQHGDRHIDIAKKHIMGITTALARSVEGGSDFTSHPSVKTQPASRAGRGSGSMTLPEED
ncbi:hypothetical protein N5D45_06670 [Stenotrophomonas sp. GD03819]|uniref:hypothetical protein n=1 Tax=Stenotrophomonas TaxID=40323 RepID=UPI0011464DD2|nr:MULTISPECIES: hypothetical protein [Stenotrophomonas]MDH1791502.1 hypothetical protein [Stenotrophomonas sp. GD03819]QGL75341.1 hypothetical protein FEO95_06740 [Stenotrophomonas maltophilia]HEL4163123.1 hypothetical protein [Stenotrophomonas maltophilia]